MVLPCLYMQMSNYRKRTLEQLEGKRWGDEPSRSSYLVTACHKLRKVPIEQLNTEDLRILLGQSIGVNYLLPVALDVLSADPLAEGDYYPGDLLSSVLRLDNHLWTQNPDWKIQLKSIVLSITDAPQNVRDECDRFLFFDE